MKYFIVMLCAMLICSTSISAQQGKQDNLDEQNTISVNQLMDCAAKFFQIKGINENGNYVVKVCNGSSGHAVTDANRNKILEGFCVKAIVKHYADDEYNLYKEMTDAVKTIYKLKLGLDKEEQLLRAQGALYVMMFQNEKLKEALLYEYEQQKKTCGFTLINPMN